MIRRLHTSRKQQKDLITWRGHEVTRIEAFSDAVFAFALTLLIVALEVPKSFEELMENMKGFLPFAVSFIIFFQVWSTQNLFFRRFGMHDEVTLVLNAMLMFVMLFFVYPMKFLWYAMLDHNKISINTDHELTKLYYIYSGGFTAIYLLFALMYWHAYRRREYLNLSPSEIFETHTYFYRHLVTASVGIVSVVLASMGGTFLAFAGLAYILLGPGIGTTHSRRGKKFKKLFDAPLKAKPAPEPVNEPEGEPIEIE